MGAKGSPEDRTANKLTQDILAYLESRGIYCWRQNNLPVPGRRFIGKRGVPDIQGIGLTGKYIGIEVKVGRDVMSDHQEAFREAAEARGAVYIVARTLDDVTKRI